MTKPSLFRRACDTLALFAVLNVLGLVGLGALLVGKGTLNVEKGRRILAVLRGQDRPAGDAADSTKSPPPGTPPRGKDATAESEFGMEIMRREGERIRAELDQRLALNNRILLRVTAERDRIQRERDEIARQQAASRQQRLAEGYQKQIAIYESLKPKVAVRHLLALAEPDEAARILVEMETSRARKIVEAAKEPNELNKMLVILRRVREVAPDRSAELEPKGG